MRRLERCPGLPGFQSVFGTTYSFPQGLMFVAEANVIAWVPNLKLVYCGVYSYLVNLLCYYYPSTSLTNLGWLPVGEHDVVYVSHVGRTTYVVSVPVSGCVVWCSVEGV